jgi:dihydrofolate reductase
MINLNLKFKFNIYIMEAIYAVDSKNGLSKEGTIPWKSKKDMKFFMNKTINNVVIMGKKTYFSLSESHRPLKNRLNIVLTCTPELYMFDKNSDSAKTALYANAYDNVIFTNNDRIHELILEDREKYCRVYPSLSRNFKIFFIGGKTIYEQFIPLCDKVWVTQIKCDYGCDLFIDYDYSKEFKGIILEEDNELVITEYIRI